MRVAASFIIAAIIAMVLCFLIDRYLQIPEALTYVIFGIVLVIGYEMMSRMVLRKR